MTWQLSISCTDAPHGVVASIPGLYFVAMPFQFGLTSQLLGGVGRDAGHVAERIAEQQQLGQLAVVRPA